MDTHQYPDPRRGDAADRLLRSVFGESPCDCGWEAPVETEDEPVFFFEINGVGDARSLRIELMHSGYGTISVDSTGGRADDCMTFVTTPARTRMVANALLMMEQAHRKIGGGA